MIADESERNDYDIRNNHDTKQDAHEWTKRVVKNTYETLPELYLT